MMLTDNILGLYELVVEEEHYFLSEHQKRISFYAGLFSALLGGTVAGYLSCKQWHHFLFLTSGPIAIAFISHRAKDGIRRMYQRFLEAVTVRAKIEERYGMAELPRPAGKNQPKIGWVLRESLIAKRHLKSRKLYGSSKEWVDKHLNKPTNYHGITIRLFDYGEKFAIILSLFTFFTAVIKFGFYLKMAIR